MHELGICDALLKMVDGIARDEGLACVRKVTVEVGSLSGIVPAYLADCWDAVTDGTPYQSTAFAVETLPLSSLTVPAARSKIICRVRLSRT